MSVCLEGNIEDNNIRTEATDGEGGDLKTQSLQVTFQYNNHHIMFLYFNVAQKDSSTSSSVITYYY